MSNNRNDVPGLAATTPYHVDDGAFGFETPSPKSSRLSTPAETKKSARDNDNVLPHHYGGQQFFTPAEKLGTALRRFQLKFFSSPFYSPRRLEDRFDIPRRDKPGSWLPPLAVVLMVGFGLVCWSRSSVDSIPSGFTFRPMPVSNSPSRRALYDFQKAYKTSTGGWLGLNDPLNPGAVFCLLDQTSTDRTLVTDTETKDFTLGFEPYLVEHLTNLLHRMGHQDIQEPLVQVRSYFSLVEGFPHIAESQYATPNGRTVLVEIRFALAPPANDDYVSSVIDTIQRYGKLHSPKYVEVTYTGLPLFQSEMVASSNDMRSLSSLLPSSAPSMVAYQRLSAYFGAGRLSPYRIVFDSHGAGRTINTKESFHIMHQVMEAFVDVDASVAPKEEEIEEDLEMMMGFGAVNLDSIPQRTEDGHLAEHLGEVMDELYGEIGFVDKDKVVPVYGARGVETFTPHQRTTYDGAAYLRNNPVPYPLFLASDLCLNHNKPHCPVELLHLFNYMSDRFTTKDGMTTHVVATLGYDPFSEDGIRWLEAARQKLQELEGTLEGMRVYIEGGASLEYDATHKTPTVLLSGKNNNTIVGIVLVAALGVVVNTVLVPLAKRVRGRGKDGQYHKNV